MTTKSNKPVPPTAMAVIKLGYEEFVLPIKDAAQIVASLASAERIESTGWGDDKLYFIGGCKAIDLDLCILPEGAYLQGKYAGPKSSNTESNN